MEQKKSAMYKLFELKDKIQDGIDNATKVNSQQEELAEIVKKAKNTKNDFKPFVKGVYETIDDLNEQISAMDKRLVDLNYILDIYNKGFKEDASDEDKFKSSFVDEIVAKVMFVLGIVKENEILDTEKTNEKQN